MTIELEIAQLPPLAEDEDENEDELPMPTFEHGIISVNLSSELRNFLKGKTLGRVVDSSTEYRFLKDKKPRSGKTPYRQPDVSFVSQTRLPARFDQYPEIAPDLVAEVVSPSDCDFDIEAKVALYQKYGVKLVWVVHPFSRRVDVYKLATKLLPVSIGIDGELSSDEVLPGFRLKVADIFDYPAPADEDDQADGSTPGE
jgi:Uma2 family endonuclease